MAQVLVRQLDDKVVDRLTKRAKEHGRSLQSEVEPHGLTAVASWQAGDGLALP